MIKKQVGRPKSDNALNKSIQIRFTEAEYNLLKEIANKEGRPVANLIRQEMLKTLKDKS